MPDLEKVIKGLEEISDYFFDVYHRSKDREEINKAKDRCDAIEDALTLLKGQEAVPVDTKMTDKNTVMGWLEGLTWDDWPRWHSDSEVQETAKAALKVMKELDAKRVLSDRECEVSPHHYERKGFCPKCHQEIKLSMNRNYCGFCGQAVKWE